VSRYFVNIADAGLGGYVAQHVNSRSKALGGFASFLWAVVR
jgi:diacylglycerol kinase family enzyme